MRSAGYQSPGQESSSGPGTVLSAEDIYKRVAPSVFIVESFDRSGAVITRGSAVAISPDSVVTNHHVTQQGVSWKLKRGDELWSATITHDDPVHDISELRATRLKTRPVDVAPLSNVQIGGRVYAVGAPAGLPHDRPVAPTAIRREYRPTS